MSAQAVCLGWATKCHEPAAYEWCFKNGYDQVIHWEVESNIGHTSPTKMLESEDICNREDCDAFKVIVCYSG